MKASVISRAVANIQGNPIEEHILHTGQHYDANLSDIFFEQLRIPKPFKQLDVHQLVHSQAIGKMMSGIEDAIKEKKPDLVLVYGDTNSTVAGALAAKTQIVPLAHVEAGLRSFNRSMPEELNRITVDHISEFLFAPSKVAVKNLQDENLHDKTYMVGDVMYDNVLFQLEYAPVKAKFAPVDPYIFMTCHRAENTDNVDRLRDLLVAIGDIPMPILCPLHPRTRKVILQNQLILPDNLIIIESLGYHELLAHVRKSSLVITDSGGLQKEAYFLQKPCLIIREETEWTELLETGFSKLSGKNFENLISIVDQLLVLNLKSKEIYGDGKAGERIVDIIKNL